MELDCGSENQMKLEITCISAIGPMRRHFILTLLFTTTDCLKIEIEQGSLTYCTMSSSITIATLQRMTRDTLAALLSINPPPTNLAIIDVRDSGTYFFQTHTHYHLTK